MPPILNNRYQISRTLGSGGFGETFLAEDTHLPSHRRCVIKQLKPIANNPQIYEIVKERFQREAAILEELGSGNNQIPSLYAYFELDTQFYLVQELIEGVTLTSKMQEKGILSESSVKEILTNILPVLDYINRKGIIHRDIKPDNIMLRSSDRQPVLIDFGAVRETMGTIVNSQGNPTSSIVIGTPGFMPSEQAAGRPVYSSDLYSLGLTAIYLLTGKTPEQLETDSRTGEIIWRKHISQISPNLAMVIDKAIMSHPRDRYSTAMDMLNALQPSAKTVTSCKTTVASPPPPRTASPQISSKPLTQDSAKTIILGSLIAGGLIGGSIIVGMAMTKTPQTTTQQPVTPEKSSSPETTITSNTTPKPIEKPVVNTANVTPSPRTTPKPSVVSRPSPEQFIFAHYNMINNREYEATWNNRLSSRFKINKSKNSYSSYLGWWTSVDTVTVESLNLVNQNYNNATVKARLKYLMKTGKTSMDYLKIDLIWDERINNWIIDNTTRLN